jgi:dienelactone hydrolase
VVSLASGCTSHTLTPLTTAADMAPTASGGGQAGEPQFDYPRTVVPFENHVIGRGASPEYTLRELVIPSLGDNGQDANVIGGSFFRSELEGPRPLVILLPIFARYTYPSKKMSTYIQRHSRGAIHVLDVRGESFLFDWEQANVETDEDRFLELFREGVERERTFVVDIRRLVDWAEQQPEIDGSRVALMGFSRSAIVAATAATQEPRLAATVVIMGGVHQHQIMARCTGPRTSEVREHVEETFGWDQDELEDRLRPIFSVVDAANYPGRVDPATVLVIEAGKDTCIPEEARRALWETMGRPEKITFNYGHKTAFISMTPLGGSWMCRKAWEFLEGRLLEDRNGG